MASTFVVRLPDATWTGVIDLAVGALTDSGELVGIAVLSPSHTDWAQALVAVTPARRRLGLGADLLLVLVEATASRGLSGIASALETYATPAQQLCRTLGLEARIVHSPQNTGVIEIPIRPHPPRPALATEGTDRRGVAPLTRLTATGAEPAHHQTAARTEKPGG